MFLNSDQQPLLHALRPSLIWRALIEDAPPDEQHELILGWLCLCYGQPSPDNALSKADIIAAFWMESEEFAAILEQANAHHSTPFESGLSMEDAEGLLGS